MSMKHKISMKHKTIIPALALLASCGGEVKESLTTESVRYNLPAEILERTIARSSPDDSQSAVESHQFGQHTYHAVAIGKPLGLLSFAIFNNQTNNLHQLIDSVETPYLDSSRDHHQEILYSLVLGEQKADLDQQEPDPQYLDFWLKVIESKQ